MWPYDTPHSKHVCRNRHKRKSMICWQSTYTQANKLRTWTGSYMAIKKAQVIAALDDLIAHEEGFRFQSLAVILATQKCHKLVAHEKKSDLGLDAYAPAVEFE